ncbi:bifunctional hydroxymethylpyrimidine kinase/phosphomethylpyrimidine kinase [Asaia sp. W19]|uniref:bifunctional hydroxymethylpyrimidine kinase/phosphomethylpyrimidine kinase n=1 Tax=unclassified Asaia TaxID=2685023 RepID=UPI000F8D21B6|nr:bifunctional hydroxymethylpyrimidine kinase/phosphomethylpyrimidine kinase [Asaia sp. W19]RUT25424.1 bifunctional hydroxymethylpyrimidine kinase/phosphomethylpyrimidine kinase [Asaia sp. W19]
MKGRVLIVAGSDSGGGAGIQADIKTVSAFGGFAMTAITAVTAQNTQGVSAIACLEPDIVAEQMRMVLDDLGADVIKLGMLGNAGIMEAVHDTLLRYPGIPCVIDPVMIATSGARLMTQEGERIFRKLYGRCTLLTPNLPELEVLSGERIKGLSDMLRAARALAKSCAIPHLLAKGGHLPGNVLVDVLVSEGQEIRFDDQRIESLHTHGTGCTLSTAIATCLAQGEPMDTAVARSRRYVRRAIREAPPYGAGNARPMNHLVPSD